MQIRAFSLTVVLAIGSSCAATPDSADDDTSVDLQPLSCNVGAPGALADACGKAANPLSITSGAEVTAGQTAYGVHLVANGSANEAVLGFEPLLSGTYDIYLGTPNIPFAVLDNSQRAPVPETPTCSSTIAATECSSLRKVGSYQLRGNASYTLRFGPTNLSYVRLYIQQRVDAPATCSAGGLTAESAACTATAGGDLRFTALPPGSESTAPIALDTVYGVHLVGASPVFDGAYAGVFDFTPASDGDYELYLGTPNVPLAISGDGAVVVGDCTRTIAASECSALRRGTRLTLRGGVTYRFELGPTSVSYVRVEMRSSASSPLVVKLGPGVQAYSGTSGEITAADLDGDGALDVVKSGGDDPFFFEVLQGSGTDSFTQVGSYNVSAPWTTTVADFSGDGVPDIVGMNWDGMGPLAPVYLQGQGALVYTQSSFGDGRDFGRNVDHADFNDDGVQDLVAQYASDQTGGPAGFVILGMPGFTVLQDEPGFGQDTLQAIAGDFDGDGHQDVVIASVSTGAIRLYRGNGSGVVTRALDTTFAGGAISQIMAVDLDGDGRSDLVVLHARTLNIAHGTPTGFATPQTLTFQGPLGGLAAGDFNHDGRLDIVTACGNDDEPPGDYRAIFVMASDAGFVATSRLLPANAPFVVGDFDNDGFADLAVASNGVLLYPSTP